MRHRRSRRDAPLGVILLVLIVALAAAIGPLMLGGRAEPAALPPPGAAPPPVEPVTLLPVTPQDARALNAAQPFVAASNPPASPFRFAGTIEDNARATDCLAAAALYEAGDDFEGQRSVIQVVLNRVRHPAYPNTVCGVVFQGSERSTGCQFTFTCDGALNRRYSSAAWERARGNAIAALYGSVDPSVGLATHYHTDWVRPVWSGSLDKVAQVGTHLFFRWPGWWGSARVMRRSGGAGEPAIGKLAGLSPFHAAATGIYPNVAVAASDAGAASEAELAAVAKGPVRQTIVAAAPFELGDTIILTLGPRAPETFPALAEQACGGREYCKVMGWSDPANVPTGGAIGDAARAAMSFSYLRNRASGLERALWNCTQFPRDQRQQCMRRG